MREVLKLENINKTYQAKNGEIEALKNINFSVEEGEFVSIIGPSGCGKSTLLSIIAGLENKSSGKIYIDEIETENVSSKIGYMLQKDHLLDWRSVYQNVILGLEIQDKLTKENIEYVHELLEEYGLGSFKDKRPSELSGGMKQRAALIRTLALKPELLLLDEAFSALDYQTRLIVSADICNIIRQTGKTMIMITHDLSEAVRLSDRVIVLTARPASVKTEVPIQLTLQDASPLAAMNAPEFSDYFNLIWKELNMHDS